MSEKTRKQRISERRTGSYERRLGGVATTAGVLYALPTVVSAAIIHFSGTPVWIDANAPASPVDIDGNTPGIEFDTSVLWDVDGGGTADFALRRTGTISTETYTGGPTGTNRFVEGFVFLDSATNGNGVVMVNNDPDPRAIQALVLPIDIGPNLIGNTTGSYAFGSAGQTGRRMMSFNSSTFYGYIQGEAGVTAQGFSGGFQPDQASADLDLFGFSFTEGGDTFFGWAKILLDTQGADRRLEIVEWAYEDTPDTGITLGASAVPVPAHGLAMLAAGAGSLLALRRRRRDEAANPAGRESDTA